jgi:hypothetical protein
MFLSDFSVKRPIAMIVLIIALMGLGLLALSKLRVNNLPDVEPPVLVVNITYPGASPETVEREVVSRIEKSMQSISGVDRLSSTAREGSAQFVLVFDFDKNLIEAADEVRNAIAAVRYKLPTEMREPILQRVDPTAQPVMQVALSSSVLDHAEISRLAEDQLADRFRALPGVAVVTVNGARRTPPRRWARCAARSRTRASASSAAWRAPASSGASSSSAGVTSWCGWPTWPPCRTATPRSRRARCATATPTSTSRCRARARPAP